MKQIFETSRILKNSNSSNKSSKVFDKSLKGSDILKSFQQLSELFVSCRSFSPIVGAFRQIIEKSDSPLVKTSKLVYIVYRLWNPSVPGLHKADETSSRLNSFMFKLFSCSCHFNLFSIISCSFNRHKTQEKKQKNANNS